MKRRLLAFVLTACMTLSLLPMGALAAETQPEIIPVAMTVGETKQLDAPAGTLYYSNAPKVVTVGEKTGFVTAVGPGKTKIWAMTGSDLAGVWEFTVTGTATDTKPPIMPEKITLTMAVGETKQLTAEGAYYFSSSYPARAAVDSKTGVVTAKEESKNNNIYATDKDGNTVGHWVITIGSVPQQPAEEVPGETGGEVVTEEPKVMFAGPTLKNQATLLGTVAEYQTTFDTMFDENGLRKVAVGFDNGKSGVVGRKYGFVNESGNFVVPPIYDEIKLFDTTHVMYLESADSGPITTMPFYFPGGYTQAKRGGKMGLINTRGEEVIPCAYDFVGMPVEGMCRLLKKTENDMFILSYWNLEQNREVANQTKYYTNYQNFAIARSQPEIGDTSIGNWTPEGYLTYVNDFMSGYALVFKDPPGKDTDTYTGAMIIDKNGNEVLPQTYAVHRKVFYTSRLSAEAYPQKGPYLAFVVPKTIKDYTIEKLNEKSGWIDTRTYETYATGLAGPSGVMIQPIYTTGVLSASSESSLFIDPATFEIIPDKQRVITMYEAVPNYLYGGRYGVIDFSGKTVIPFSNVLGVIYDGKHEVFIGDKICDINGKVIDKRDMQPTEYAFKFFFNGYARVAENLGFNKTIDTNELQTYYIKPDGSELNVDKLMDWPVEYRPLAHGLGGISQMSTSGLGWIRDVDGKWGLINFAGQTVLPFEYDNVTHANWAREKSGYAIVTKDGKQGLVNAEGKLVLPCIYSSFSTYAANTTIGECIVMVSDSGKGLADIKTGKIIIPAIYDAVGAFANYKQHNDNLFAMGCYVVQKGENNILLDGNGNQIYSTTKKFNEAQDGLYRYNDNSGYFNNRGQMIFPGSLEASTSVELFSSHTIYKDGDKVYRISANYIDSTYAVKPYAPEKVTATASPTKLMVDGKSVAVDAYAIGGNNYIKLRDLATMVNGTEKSFDVTWDGSKNAINLISGKGYTSVGGEMAAGDGQSKAATRNSAKIFVDGSEVSMTAYTIGSNNYFKLRDVMQIFRIGVGYDGATATLATSEEYALTAAEQKRYDAHVTAYKTATGKDFPKVTDTIAPPKTSAPGGVLEGGTYQITIDVPTGGYATVTPYAATSSGQLGITDMVGSVPITFTLRHMGNNKYTFQTSKGTFLTSTGGIGSTVSHQRENEKTSQTFIIEKASGGKYRIYNSDWLAWTIKDNDFSSFGIDLQKKAGDTYQTFKFTLVDK